MFLTFKKQIIPSKPLRSSTKPWPYDVEGTRTPRPVGSSAIAQRMWPDRCQSSQSLHRWCLRRPGWENDAVVVMFRLLSQINRCSVLTGLCSISEVERNAESQFTCPQDGTAAQLNCDDEALALSKMPMKKLYRRAVGGSSSSGFWFWSCCG